MLSRRYDNNENNEMIEYTIIGKKFSFHSNTLILETKLFRKERDDQLK